MAQASALQNTPIQINLLAAANDVGWSLPGDGTAKHVSCNYGSITSNYPVVAGNQYSVAWVLLTNSGGFTQIRSPGSFGAMQTVPNTYVETLTPTSNGFITIFSNSNCTVTGFSVLELTQQVGTTIAYSALNRKWSDFRTFYPDYGWSLYENTITAKNGQLYLHLNGTNNTNNFYGTAYQSIIQAVFAKTPSIISTYEVFSYQANMLLVSTQGGITTSLGQQTTLIDSDFMKQALSDGVTSVVIYQTDNVYSASFWNNELYDTVNGENLKGNYIIIQMTTVDGSTILKLFSMSVKKVRTFIGNR